MANTNASTKGTKKFGSQRHNVRRKVVSLRTKGMAWREIAQQLEIAPRTVRRLFDEAKGEGAHFESRVAGKGGRTRQLQAA